MNLLKQIDNLRWTSKFTKNNLESNPINIAEGFCYIDKYLINSHAIFDTFPPGIQEQQICVFVSQPDVKSHWLIEMI